MTSHFLPFETAPEFNRVSCINHGFFGRRGGVSTGIYESLNAGEGSSDSSENIVENRKRIERAMGAKHLLSCYQIHSAKAITIDAPFTARPEADAMVTKTPGLALCILTADCAPILFADPKAGIVGAAHAGWKGALSGIVRATLEAIEALGGHRKDTVAIIGPCIGQQSYEVGPEFMDRFCAAAPSHAQFFQPGKTDRLHFDLAGFLQAEMQGLGIGTAQCLNRDTCALKVDYFSNRRRNHRGEPDYGRNASVIVCA